MQDHIFRLYDIRGKVGSEMPIDHVEALTHAIAYYFKQNKPEVRTIAVGADGRTHSPAIKERVCKALQDAGLHVIFVGTCPSPVLYFSLYNLPVDAGIMITASHNGPEYNGLKICLGTESVWGTQIQEIKTFYQQGVKLSCDGRGGYQEQDVIALYISWLKNNFQHLVGCSLKAVVDCGNGAGGTVMPKLVQAFQWRNVTLLYAEVDGTYPNHEADPTVEENMQDVKSMLAASDLACGIGLDGDCDRMAAMTKSGELVQGDKLLAVFACELVKTHPGASIVFDIKCSSGLSELLMAWHARPVMSPSGHSIIKGAMKREHALLGGELSCHFFFKDKYYGYDDAFYAMLRLFELLKDGTSLEALLACFPHKVSTREYRIACDQDKMARIVHAVQDTFMRKPGMELVTIDGIRVSMQHGWGMLRASNTQPVLCLRFEANTNEQVSDIKEQFIDALMPFYDKAYLIKNLA
ncbi:MAG: phosphomannomutase/phosphoglucomutase [Candidatus Babeliales bacterium]